MAGEVGPPDLAAFQAAYDLDQRCLKGLGELTPSDQHMVIDSVSNMQCKNASAVTWATVKRMKEHPAAVKLEYLRRHLDARALEALGKLPIQAQESVAAHVDVMRVRNLSAFAWKQIQAAQRGGVDAAPPRLPPPMPPPRPAAVKRFFSPQAPPMAAASLAAAQAARDLARERSRSPAMVGGGLSMQIAQLRASIATSSGTGSMGRGRSGGAGGGGASDGATSQFLATAGLDPQAAQALMSLDAGSQRMVVGLTQRKPCRNVSAVTWSMVKLVREKPLEAKMEYLRATLDGEALAALEKLPSSVQDGVLGKVDVAHCRNLSAFVWSQVKGHLAPPRRAGGGDLGRAEAEPRRGYQARPSRGPGVDAGVEDELVDEPLLGELPYHEDEEEEVLGEEEEVDGEVDPIAAAGVEIDGRCLAKLRELPNEVQLAILQSVPEDCRNPSAYVWSKVKNSLRKP